MIGMMWADSNPKHSLAQRVTEASTAYHRKHGRWPTVCQIRSMGSDTPETVELQHGGIVRLTTGPMARYHLLIGENGDQNDVPDA